MSIWIEGAKEADLPEIFKLLEASGLPREGLEDHWATTLVARAGLHIVGSAALELYGTAALLRSVAVDFAFRSRGLGRKLTQAALNLAREQGVTTVYLLTESAGGFFARLGFRPIPRSEVIPDVLQSVEFTSACPASAQVMMYAEIFKEED